MAILVAATTAAAVDQVSKNGCTSPVVYSGALTSPSFFTGSGSPGVSFQGWFEVEGVDPVFEDQAVVEYDIGGLGNWVEFGRLNPPSGGGGATDQGWSFDGLGTAPAFHPYSFTLPPEAQNQSDVRIRFRFDTGDELYQGFRGVAVDDVLIVTGGSFDVTEGFEFGAEGWIFDPPAGPGAPFWHILDNPQRISVKSPEINPTLVTLPDSGALPAAFEGANVAWFGDDATGTFCGPDYANLIVEQQPGDTVPPETTITGGPSGSTSSTDALVSFESSEAGSSFECRLDGGTFAPCSSPQSFSGLSLGGHSFEVRATDPAANVDPTPAARSWTIVEGPPVTLADLPDPQLAVAVNVQQVKGEVLVGVPGSSTRGSARASQKGVRFVPLSEARQIPVGSFLNTKKGTVRLQSARNSRGTRQTGDFSRGLFQVRQSRKRSAKGLTELRLKGGSFRGCNRSAGISSVSAPRAEAARKAIRRLRGNASGRFRSRGRRSSATVRGTTWDTIDRCDGTLTRVKKGRVLVRDFRLRRDILLRRGQSYLALARGRS
jgi:hypothetical protein